MNRDDTYWMQLALQQAETAAAQNEVPVGAVVVRDGTLVGTGSNQTIALDDPSAHAEIIAMRDAGKCLGNYRLPGCTLYVTLEPCMMCAGAIVHARLEALVFAAPDPKTGAIGGRMDLLGLPEHNHRVAVRSGVLAEPSGELLRTFFRQRRK